MSAVHDSLHGSDKLSAINLKTYLSKIISSVFQTYAINPNEIILNNSVADIQISIDLASPFGLVINELITNALKYAFPNGKKGELTVSVDSVNEKVALTVQDNGIGIPKDFDWKNSNTLGLELVRTLVENQLDGSVELERENGTKFIINFNIEA